MRTGGKLNARLPEGDRESIITFWENYHSSGRDIGGYPLSSTVELWFMEHMHSVGDVLEIASGTGRTYSHLINMAASAGCGSVFYVGADASPSAVERASRRKGFNGVLADMFHLPFDNGAFDFIYSRNAFQGYPADRLKMLGPGITRLLKNGGSIGVEERGPLDRLGIEEAIDFASSHDFMGTDSLTEIFSDLEVAAATEDLHKRKTKNGTVVAHTSTVILVKR